MKITPDQFILASFLGAVTLLIAVSFASYRSTVGMLESTRAVAHTLEVHNELSSTLVMLTNAETGQRGYLLTGDLSHLEPYYFATSAIQTKLAHLRTLAADNGRNQRILRELDEVDRLAQARMTILGELIEMRRAQGEVFKAPLDRLQEGKFLMDRLRERVALMYGAENRALSERQALVTAAAQRTLLIIPLSGLLALAVTIIALVVLRREFVKRQHAEEKAHAFTRELERSNRELEDFAYVTSHDLQEPLRKIQAFGDLLRASHATKLDEEGRDFIARMQNAAQRMQILINDLLMFSRVRTKGQPFTSVDLNRIAQEVLNDLEIRLEQTEGHVVVNELPIIEADPVQMRQLLQNLIGNALKFHRHDVPPFVTVRAESGANTENSTQEFCQLMVEDNGIGFEERYLDRIFTPFQRLHGRGEYEGTGMGLAVCRRIAERHGGTISARSVPGEGSVFFVNLPFTQPDASAALSARTLDATRQNLRPSVMKIVDPG